MFIVQPNSTFRIIMIIIIITTVIELDWQWSNNNVKTVPKYGIPQASKFQGMALINANVSVDKLSTCIINNAAYFWR